jgi:zinc and cadmium transporter
MILESILSATIVVSLISLSGIVLIFWRENLVEQSLGLFISTASGVLLTTVFMDLMPEALNKSHDVEGVSAVIFLGVVIMFLLERSMIWFHHHDDLHGIKPSVYMILIGDSIHNFIDGLAIAAAFLISPALGFGTTVAVAAHEIPHEISDFILLISGGLRFRHALFYNFLSALTAVAGGIIGYYMLSSIDVLVPYLLAFTSGTFIYIACSDLIPEMHQHFIRKKQWRHTGFFLGGILLMILFVRLFGG